MDKNIITCIDVNGNIRLCFASDYNYGNFGDLLSRYIVEKVSNRSVVKSDYKQKEQFLCAIGSVLGRNDIFTNELIWGSGFLSHQSTIKIILTKYWMMLRGLYGKPKIYATRGLKTESILEIAGLKCPHVYGDPALLMLYFFKSDVKKKYRLGVILHNFHSKLKDIFIKIPGVRVIEINRSFNELERFVDEVNECEVILSSAMHGLIIANAYKVPCVRLKFANCSIHVKPEREDFKFEDYLSGLNTYANGSMHYEFAKICFASDIVKDDDIKRIVSMATTPAFNIDYKKLLDAFPCVNNI